MKEASQSRPQAQAELAKLQSQLEAKGAKGHRTSMACGEAVQGEADALRADLKEVWGPSFVRSLVRR